MITEWRGKCLLKLEPGLSPTAGKAQVRAQGLDNEVAQCVINSPCRTVTHRTQSDAVYEGLMRVTERTDGSQISQLQAAFISQHENLYKMGLTHASNTQEQPCPQHSQLPVPRSYPGDRQQCSSPQAAGD